jgi:hypothetical protein
MTDNINITEGSGAIIATDKVGTDHYQKIKLADGADDSATMVGVGVGAAANALRVALATSSEIIANLSATDNAVLDAIEEAVEACQAALEATLTIEGTVDLGATDNAVLDAIQAATEAIKTAVEGTVTVDGTVTANLDATNTGYLLAIKTALEIIDNAIDGNEMQVDVVSGAVTANLDATNTGYLLAIKTAIEILDNIVDGSEAQVDIVSGTLTGITNDVSIDDGGNSITVDGTVTANLGATDTGKLTDIKTAVEIIDNAIDGSEMQVDVVGALPAGTNAIGKLAANSGVDIGDVDVLSIAAGENHIGEIGLADDTITITCTLDTSALCQW